MLSFDQFSNHFEISCELLQVQSLLLHEELLDASEVLYSCVQLFELLLDLLLQGLLLFEQLFNHLVKLLQVMPFVTTVWWLARNLFHALLVFWSIWISDRADVTNGFAIGVAIGGIYLFWVVWAVEAP